MPQSFTLLTSNPETTAAATRISVPVIALPQIWQSVSTKHAHEDRRMSIGLLEQEFPDLDQKHLEPVELNDEASEQTVSGSTEKEETAVNGQEIESVNETATGETSAPATSLPKEEHNPTMEITPPCLASITDTGPRKTADQILEESLQQSLQAQTRQAERRQMSVTPPNSTGMGVVTPPHPLSLNEAVQLPLTPPPTLARFGPIISSPDAQKVDVDSVKSPVSPNMRHAEYVESDLDSDEEIIVFTPRARRTSAKSRPTTSSGQQIKRAQDTAPGRPMTSNGQATSDATQLKPKLASVSTLKPQSPSFTPGRLYISSAHEQAPTQITHNIVVPASPPKKVQQPHKPQQTRPQAPPRQPRANGLTKRPTPDQVQAQRQSELILQRQRDAIERQTRTTTKPPPRKVQMEPTSNPTVIDPDAFDRSYVVQTPSNPQSNLSNSATAKPRPAPRRRTSPKREGKADSARRESPTKHASKPATEADVDFVLKSGAPRGSARGKGKLWIP